MLRLSATDVLQVVSLKKIAPESEASFEAEAPGPQVHTRLTSAAMRATAQQAQAQPTAQVGALLCPA